MVKLFCTSLLIGISLGVTHPSFANPPASEAEKEVAREAIREIMDKPDDKKVRHSREVQIDALAHFITGTQAQDTFLLNRPFGARVLDHLLKIQDKHKRDKKWAKTAEGRRSEILIRALTERFSAVDQARDSKKVERKKAQDQAVPVEPHSPSVSSGTCEEPGPWLAFAGVRRLWGQVSGFMFPPSNQPHFEIHESSRELAKQDLASHEFAVAAHFEEVFNHDEGSWSRESFEDQQGRKFYKYWNRGDGDCALHGLRKTRADFVKHVQDALERNFAGNLDLRNDLRDEVRRYCDRSEYQGCDRLYDSSHDKDTQWLFLDYLKERLPEHSEYLSFGQAGGGICIGTLPAAARVFRMNVRVWRVGSNGKVEQACEVHQGGTNEYVNLLHTGIHFDSLVEENNIEKRNEAIDLEVKHLEGFQQEQNADPDSASDHSDFEIIPF